MGGEEGVSGLGGGVNHSTQKGRIAGATLETNVRDPTNTSSACFLVSFRSKKDWRSASMVFFRLSVIERVKLSKLTKIPVTTAIDSNRYRFFSAKMIPRYAAQRSNVVIVLWGLVSMSV